MTNNFIKETVERILGIDPEEYVSPNQFVNDWRIAGKALLAIQNLNYTIELASYGDDNFTVGATRWEDTTDSLDYAFSTGKSLPKCILEVLIKVHNDGQI